jgi:hypothetical protein
VSIVSESISNDFVFSRLTGAATAPGLVRRDSPAPAAALQHWPAALPLVTPLPPAPLPPFSDFPAAQVGEKKSSAARGRKERKKEKRGKRIREKEED